ncbi:hypothetical protein ID866_5183 [Astraeus odoratus]|nr:hypothetical protein ID866_5183 [Astraeus odoratus]
MGYGKFGGKFISVGLDMPASDAAGAQNGMLKDAGQVNGTLRQVFYRAPLSYAIVNLKPIVPGHVLVIPTRVVPRLADLTGAELSSLITSVQTVGNVIEKVYGGDALTVACQV